MAGEDALQRAILERRQVVNEALEGDFLAGPSKRLHQASRHLLDAGGKRLRPAVLLLSAEALADIEPGSIDYRAFPDANGGEVDVLDAAVAIEIVQSFTLIHDDIMDDDDMRRGVPAVHRAFDLSTAILAGDAMYSRAFEQMLDTGAPAERLVDALADLAHTCTVLCEGQSLDMEFERGRSVTVDEYLDMIELKTGALYAAAASTPATLLGHEAAAADLRAHGIDVGRAFQIKDDLLDLTTPTEKLGKQRGSDLVEGKQTLVTVHAREQGVDVDALVESDTVEGVSETEIDAAVERLREVGSIEYARDTAEEFVERGKARLDVLPDNEARDLLAAVADFLVEREY